MPVVVRVRMRVRVRQGSWKGKTETHRQADKSTLTRTHRNARGIVTQIRIHRHALCVSLFLSHTYIHTYTHTSSHSPPLRSTDRPFCWSPTSYEFLYKQKRSLEACVWVRTARWPFRNQKTILSFFFKSSQCGRKARDAVATSWLFDS